MTPSRISLITALFTLLSGTIPLATDAADEIVEVRGGSATIEKEDGRSQRINGRTELRSGDLIVPDAGVVVVIRCHNGSGYGEVRSITGLGDVCPDSVGSRYPTTGRGEDDFLAFLNQVFVYATQILAAQPQFRWNAIPNAISYQVQVLENDRVIWEETTQDTTIQYNGSDLELGKEYELNVIAIDEQNVEQGEFSLIFRRLDQAQIETVQTKISELEAQNLSEAAKAVVRTTIYQEIALPNTLPPTGSGLVLEAIPPLEAIVAQGNPTADVHRLLGDLYLQVGLLDAAAIRYQATLNLTQTDPSEQMLRDRAAAQVGLANIAAANGERDQAESWLQQAKQSYEELGERDRVGLIDQWIDKLKL